MSNSENPILDQKATINPYRHGLYLILDRLRWDLTPASWISTSKLKSWKNKYTGEKAVIVCNGPSLLKSDLSLLENTFTFGLNKINLLFDKSDFRPSCIVSVNRFVIEQNATFYNETNIPLFLSRRGRKLVSLRKNVAFLHSTNQLKFARDCSVSLQEGGTVTFIAMQLAFHMGFKEVALIGCDHNFATKGPANKTVTSGKTDKSHFDPNYFAGGVKWQLPDLPRSEFFYSLAREVYEANDRKIVNATEGGNLEIFVRTSLKEFIG